MKFIEKYQKFMYGRYGSDELYNFLFKVYLITFIISLFFNNRIIRTFELLLVIIILYRFFSKNKYKRSIENKKFLNIKNRILNLKISNKYRDGYVYKKCPKCKKLLKLPLPYSIGIKKVKCPKCKKIFKMLVLRKEKVEFVRNKN